MDNLSPPPIAVQKRSYDIQDMSSVAELLRSNRGVEPRYQDPACPTGGTDE